MITEMLCTVALGLACVAAGRLVALAGGLLLPVGEDDAEADLLYDGVSAGNGGRP